MIDTEHIAQTEPESAEPEAVEPQITRFDNAGDLRLLVWDQTPEAVQRVFIVSSKAMSMACVAWNSMLNGSFKEAQPTSGEREVELPDDDPAALEVLLNIAHLRFDWVPSWLYFNVLLQVTVLTDKYDMTRLIRPWATSWFQTAQRLVSVTQSGYEEWLWIAWELGQTHTFETLATHLVKSVRVDNNGNCTTNTGKLLDPCRSTGQQFPPGIIESLQQARLKVISDLLEIYYSTLDKFIGQNLVGSSICQGTLNDRGHRQECDELTFGSLSFALRRAGFSLQRVYAPVITNSVDELLVRLRSITVNSYHTPTPSTASLALFPGRMDECANCRLNNQLTEAVGRVENSIPSAVTDVHRDHLTRQAKKLGYTS
ncbi:hypothetical protein HDK90DRAFT_97554 [Phyllosticta capitalensis]|uniref:Nuclear pore protein n=1 Tax=Phyllosticta capitalensis TaxID=121624 RepID=A0ABR1Y9W9_9PEZI